MSNDFKFLDLPRQDPEKVPARERKREFKEIYGHYVADQAAAQSERCFCLLYTSPSPRDS